MTTATQTTTLRITFRAKVRSLDYTDGTLASRYVQIPSMTRHHVDMHAARQHPRFGAYANSDFFAGMLRGAVERRVGSAKRIDLLKPLPAGVVVDESGFLAVVTIDVE